MNRSPSWEDLTPYLHKRIDKNNVLNKDFTWEGRVRDGIGLGMSTNKLIYFKFGLTQVKGVVCSGNSIPGAVPSEFRTLDCFDVMSGNDKI